MSERPEGPLWDALRSISEGATESFLEKAKEAKRVNYVQVLELWRQNGILDQIVAYVAPDADWQPGWGDGSSSSSSNGHLVTPYKPATKTDRILDIAEDLADETYIVTSKAIAEQLRSEGRDASVRDLSVSAGNVLNRSGLWSKIEAGKYQYQSLNEAEE